MPSDLLPLNDLWKHEYTTFCICSINIHKQKQQQQQQQLFTCCFCKVGGTGTAGPTMDGQIIWLGHYICSDKYPWAGPIFD